jgi:hypothetical protein
MHDQNYSKIKLFQFYFSKYGKNKINIQIQLQTIAFEVKLQQFKNFQIQNPNFNLIVNYS